MYDVDVVSHRTDEMHAISDPFLLYCFPLLKIRNIYNVHGRGVTAALNVVGKIGSPGIKLNMARDYHVLGPLL